MPEQVELENLVDDEIECQTVYRPLINNNQSSSNCKSCPYLGLLLATLSSLFFSLCSVIVKSLVDVS